MQFVLPFQAVINHRPGTGSIQTDFATAVLRPAAGTVKKTFGTAGHRTDATGKGQHAIAATPAHFSPDSGLGGSPEKGCVERGNHRQRIM